MEEILKGIKDLETFENRKQQWNLIKEIDGNSEKISEGELQDREEFEKIKMQLINTIDLTINRDDFEQITNDSKIAVEHLLALKGCLILMKFDNIADSKEDIQKFRFSILKDMRYKTLGQEIEEKECEDEVKSARNLRNKIILGDDFAQDDEQQSQCKMPAVRKNKVNIFVKIKQFLKNTFGRKKMIREQNMLQREEELKFNKSSVAPLLKMNNDSEQQMNFNNMSKTQIESVELPKDQEVVKKEFEQFPKEQEVLKNNFDKSLEELDEQKRESENSKKEFAKRIKVNGKYEWKNGNYVIIDDIEEKEEEAEKVME